MQADQVLEQDALAAAADADDGDGLRLSRWRKSRRPARGGRRNFFQIAHFDHHRSRVLSSMVKKKLLMRMVMEE